MIASPLLARLNQACINQPRSKRDLAFDPAHKRIARLEARVPLLMAMAREALRQAMAGHKAAQEAHVARLAADVQQRGRPDFGPSIRQRRGEIAEEDRPDIDSEAEFKPTIRGGRRADPLRVLLGIKNLHKPHDGAEPANARRWVAAQVYRNVQEIAGGARLGEKPMERVDRSSASFGPTDMVLDCTSLMARAKVATGASYPAVRWMVEEYSGLDEFAVVNGQTEAEAKAVLLVGLDALVDVLGDYHGPGGG